MMRLLCLGDIALANKNLRGQTWLPPADLEPGDEQKVLFNWEFPIGETTNPHPRVRGIRFVAFPDSLPVLEKWSPGFATLANNHVLDAGSDGLLYTVEALHRAGFSTVGAGQDSGEIESPLFWETREGKVAIVNWVFAETHPDWMSVPGPNCWPGQEKARCIIADLKKQADWVLVVVHWSDELFPYPLLQDRAVASELAQMGADMVIGQHPHVVRGMEIFGSCPIFYSLGNFYFAETKDETGNWVLQEAPRTREALGLMIDFQHGQAPSYQILSFWNTKRESILDPLRRAKRRCISTSRPLRLHHGEDYAKWYALERARFDRWGSRWHFGLMRWGVAGSLIRIWHKVQRALASR